MSGDYFCLCVCVCVCVFGVCLYSDGIWAYTSTAQLSVCVVCTHGRGWVWVVLPRALCSSRESDLWPPHSTPSQAFSTLCVGISEYVCCLESNVLYVWAETRLFALSALCLHRQCIQYSPDVTLYCLFSVLVHVYDTVCTHWASTVIAKSAITYKFIRST